MLRLINCAGTAPERTTAFGSFGRASCTGVLSAPDSAGTQNGDGGSSAQAR
ncbi:MAG TPA: hypothetical protein VFY14_04675 [Streptomyces sp.]|nr:hypothetical protein [Streptomyces sp.]